MKTKEPPYTERYVRWCGRSANQLMVSLLPYYVRLAAHVSKGWKSQIRPSSGKDIAKTKGVHREVESEGRWRQISGLTNRNHIRLQLRIRLQHKLKSNNYSELTVVNVADRWRERNVWYLGRSRQQAETAYETCSNNEWQEVSRGHSTTMVANVVGRTEL